MNKYEPKILGIDTSCDDTSVAVLQGERVLSSIVSSQIDIHKEWGGVVPKLAQREHEKMIDETVALALKRAGLESPSELNAIAVTYGPGLAPALEVGVRTAKELAAEFTLPLLAVDHMEGHALSALLRNSTGNTYSGIEKVEFPFMALCVSGGHTEIILANAFGKYEMLGQTLDDAAGEAFDKIGRMLGLGYPGGPVIARLAQDGSPTAFDLPRPMFNTTNHDFSFSGLKTAALYNTNTLKDQLGDEAFAQIIPDYCASVQEAIVETLVTKTVRAATAYQPTAVLLGGGVSANVRLRQALRAALKEQHIPLYAPEKKFSTDNGAMIALAGYYKYQRGETVSKPEMLDRDPSIVLSNYVPDPTASQ